MADKLLLAARAKFLASEQFIMLDAAGVIGATEDGSPWVTIADNPKTGLPWNYGDGQAAVTFGLGARQWSRSLDHSTKYPRLAVVVWTFGDTATPDAAWLAHDVGQEIVSVFDKPAGVYEQWTPDVYVLRSRWDGELTIFEAEGVPGLIRAHLGFETEIA